VITKVRKQQQSIAKGVVAFYLLLEPSTMWLIDDVPVVLIAVA